MMPKNKSKYGMIKHPTIIMKIQSINLKIKILSILFGRNRELLGVVSKEDILVAYSVTFHNQIIVTVIN